MTYIQITETVRQAGRHCRDPEIRGKIDLFLRALRSGEILQTCAQAGKAPRYYYYWWNRFRDSGFQIQALKKKSRRPKRSPRKISARAIRWIKHYRRTYSYNPEVIALYLEKEKGIKVSKATVYRTLLRERMPLLKRGTKKRETPAKAARRNLSRGRGTEPKASPSLSPPLLPEQAGRVLAKRYELIRLLGMGGGGAVYLAGDRKAKEDKLALKLLPWREGTDLSLALSLKNEFQILSELRHPHLARVFDFGNEGREIFFTSEWIEGPNILGVCKDANFNTVFQLLVQVLKGLDYLHAKGVLHLDLKPENILVTDPSQRGNLQVKLIDFGTAQWAKQGPSTAGDFVGTPPYSAPEMILQGAPGPTSDIYSLGMVLHQIFANRFPFESVSPLDIMKEQIYGEAQTLQTLPAGLPPQFATLLRRMVARESKDRPQSVAEVLDSLNEILGENFTLKDKTAPLKALEESEFIFHRGLRDELVSLLQDAEPRILLLAAPAHMGKTFLLNKIKHRLQLAGQQPLTFEAPEDLKEFLLTNPQPMPLLVDFGPREPEDWGDLFELLENSRCPALLTTSLEPSPDMNPSFSFTLPPLSLEQIVDFLSSELKGFPEESLALPIYALTRGIPVNLAEVLQALQEEGHMQWTEQGWAWVAGADVEFKTLLQEHDRRWRERLQRCLEILKFTHLPLSAANLEGLLALDPGALHESLARWTREGHMESKIIRRIPHYFSGEKKSAEHFGPVASLDWAETELARLYEAGDFQSGFELSQILLDGVEKGGFRPPRLILLAARHLVSAGYAERALKILPADLSKLSAADAGLVLEIGARARFNLGKTESAETEMTKAETSYRAASDETGIARIQNLKGLALQRLQRFDEAEAAFRACIESCRAVGENYIQALALMNLGIFYYDQGRFEATRQSYLDAFALEKTLNQPVLSCKLRENWVNLLYHLGQSAEAERACYDLLKTSIHYRYREQQAAALNYLSLLAGQRENPPLQLQYLNQALAILDPEIHRQLYFQTKVNRSYAHLALKKYVAAQLDAESAVEMAGKSAVPQWLAFASLTLGRTMRDRPQADLLEATKLFNNAQMIIRKNNIRQLAWEIEFERGLLAKKKGERERAKNYFLSAQAKLQDYLDSLPEAMRTPYLRNRQWDRIAAELKNL